METIIGQIVVRGQEFDVAVSDDFGYDACVKCALYHVTCFVSCRDFARSHGGDPMYMYLKEKESNEE